MKGMFTTKFLKPRYNPIGNKLKISITDKMKCFVFTDQFNTVL